MYVYRPSIPRCVCSLYCMYVAMCLTLFFPHKHAHTTPPLTGTRVAGLFSLRIVQMSCCFCVLLLTCSSPLFSPLTGTLVAGLFSLRVVQMSCCFLCSLFNFCFFLRAFFLLQVGLVRLKTGCPSIEVSPLVYCFYVWVCLFYPCPPPFPQN